VWAGYSQLFSRSLSPAIAKAQRAVRRNRPGRPLKIRPANQAATEFSLARGQQGQPHKNVAARFNLPFFCLERHERTIVAIAIRLQFLNQDYQQFQLGLQRSFFLT
jgi:hypothetical protein